MKKIIFIFILIALTGCVKYGSEEVILTGSGTNNIVNNGNKQIVSTGSNINNIINDNKDMSKLGIYIYNNGNNISGFNGNLSLCDINKNLFICRLLNKNYFYNTYYLSCLGNKEITECNKLPKEQKKYCKGNFYLIDLLSTRDKSICNNFKKDFSFGYLMGTKKYNNYELCNKTNNDLLSKENINKVDIDNFINDLNISDSNISSVRDILYKRILNKKETKSSFINYIQFSYRTNTLDCNKLNNNRYILKKLKGFKYIFDSKNDVIDIYNKLGNK